MQFFLPGTGRAHVEPPEITPNIVVKTDDPATFVHAARNQATSALISVDYGSGTSSSTIQPCAVLFLSAAVAELSNGLVMHVIGTS